MENIGIEPRQLLMQLINFTLMIVILTKLLYKPIIKMLDDRKKKIEDSLIMAEKTKEELEKTEKKREEVIKKAVLESKEIIEEAKKTAKKVEAEIIEKAQEEAKAVLEKGKKDLESERALMEKELKRQTIEIASNIAEKAIGQILSGPNQQKLIEKKLNELQRVTV
jgi:F-type H+-transporting ATPase subunit b